MNEESVVEDLKDAVTDILAPEYHRLNVSGVKHFLGSFEVFLGAVVTAFLVPFVKKLAEKSAEHAWEKIAKTNREKAIGSPQDDQPSDLILNAKYLLKNSDPGQLEVCGSYAQERLFRYLDEYDMPMEVKVRTSEEMMLCIRRIASAGTEGKQ